MAIVVKDYNLIDDWQISTGGKTAIGEKASKKYFLKKYINIARPIKTSSMSKANFDRKMELFQKTVKMKEKINKKLLDIWVMDGNIVSPVDFFIDDDNRYVEVTQYFDNICSNPFSLTMNQKDLILKTIVGSLAMVHSQDIIHADLKMTNILVCKNKAGNYVGKIIDFDCSYFSNNIPKGDMGGDQLFIAPEVGMYMINDMDPVYAKQISCKADIFALGIIYHLLLTNKFPQQVDLPSDLKSKTIVYPFEALLTDKGKLIVDSSIISPYKEIIELMLHKDPIKRPSAIEILEMLKDPSSCLSNYQDKYKEEVITLIKETTPTPSVAPVEEPEIIFERPTSTPKPDKTPKVTKEEPVVESEDELFNPYAVKAHEESSLWPEHEKEYKLNETALRNRGYIKIEKFLKGTDHVYALTKENGDVKILAIDTMYLLSYVTKESK